MLHARLLTLAALAWVATPGLGTAAGPPFELAVKQDRLLGSTRGTLVFTENEVQFRAPDPKEGRRWSYLALKQVRVLGPTRIAIDTYEDRGRLRLGADRSYEFEVVDGAVREDLIGFLLARLERPVVTAVMPPLEGQPLFRVPVKHQRQGHGSDGTLLLYPDGLAYLTERETEARYWRLRDVFAVLQLDRYRLQVVTYEGGSGATRPYTFELKTDLPATMYDALWQRVNAPALAGGSPRVDRAVIGDYHRFDPPAPGATQAPHSRGGVR